MTRPLRLLLPLVLAAACYADPATDPEGGDAADDPASNTDLDLLAFRKHAISRLKKHFGSNHNFNNGEILFVDGASSLDLPPAFDHARLYYAADVPALDPTDDMRVAYSIGFQGDEGFRLLNGNTAPFDLSAIAVIKDDRLDDPGVAALVKALEKEVPGADVQLLGAIGLITFAPPTGKGFIAMFELAAKSPLIASVDVSSEAFPIPFEFAEPISLGTGKKKKIVELLDHASVTLDLREDGVPFTTEPSLPEPFGPGRIDNNTVQQLFVTVVDGASVEVCAEQATAFDGITLLDTLGALGAFTVEATASAAAKLGTLQCVATIEPLDGGIGPSGD